jgi:hypothetical protein
MADRPEFVLFIIDTDKFCLNFITKLKTKEELFKKFNIVDINRIPAIPDEIDEVPSVYDGKKIYKGKEAFSWLNEKMMDFLSPANDGISYSFLDGQEEQIFGNYSLLDQKNGSFGMGSESDNSSDPTRTNALTDNSSKLSSTYENLISSRNQDIDIVGPNQKQNLNKF